MKYSIIIPIFNSSKYLNKCIESVLNQTFTDFELILVDDGSTDDSLSFCKMYKNSDSRIRVFHKENGGVSSARNFGIKKAKGEKILFFDSDDFVELNALDVIDSYDSDLVVFNSSIEKNKTIQIEKESLEYDFFCGKLMKELLFSACNKVFLAKIIRDNCIQFDEKIKIGEDMLFLYDYIKAINTIQIINNNLYHYEIRSDSTMNNSKRDYLMDYISTFEALKYRIRNNISVLSSWCVDVLAIIFVRQFFSKMKFKEFNVYMRGFEKTEIRHYACINKDKKSFSKKIMMFLIKNKFYRLLHIAIKIRN